MKLGVLHLLLRPVFVFGLGGCKQALKGGLTGYDYCICRRFYLSAGSREAAWAYNILQHG